MNTPATIGLGLVVLVGFLLASRNGSSLPDPSTLGAKREKKLNGTAVICGGRCVQLLSTLAGTFCLIIFPSFSGILAARVCSDHFEEVLLVDPEFSKTLHSGEKTRIMQYKASHSMPPF